MEILQNILAQTALKFHISHFVKIWSIFQDGNYHWEFPPPVFTSQPWWKGIVAKSSVMPQQSSKVMGKKRNWPFAFAVRNFFITH